jgi:hypothetical protein
MRANKKGFLWIKVFEIFPPPFEADSAKDPCYLPVVLNR